MTAWLSRLPRRAAMISLVLIAVCVVTVLAPLLFVGAAVLDAFFGDSASFMGRLRERPRVRTLTFVWLLLLNEVFGIAVLFALWVITVFGVFMHSSWSYAVHGWVHGRWTRNILNATKFCFSTSVRFEGLDIVEPAPVVVLARHISLLDAVLPSIVLTHRRGHAPRHVFMRELRFDPCIDTLGGRTPNHLVDRIQGGRKELAAISAVGATLDEHGSGVIFPEGGFRTPKRFARAMKSLDRRNPVLADRARSLRHVMPPKPGGAHALVTAAPDADVVMLAHRGFDGVSTIADIGRGQRLPAIDVKLTRFARSEVPEDSDEFGVWLFERFAEIDDWIDERLGTDPAASEGADSTIDLGHEDTLLETSPDTAIDLTESKRPASS